MRLTKLYISFTVAIVSLFVASSALAQDTEQTVDVDCEVIAHLYGTEGECLLSCPSASIQLRDSHIDQISGISSSFVVNPCYSTDVCCLVATDELSQDVAANRSLDLDQSVLDALLLEASGESSDESQGEGGGQSTSQQLYDPLGGASISKILGGLIQGFIGISGSIALLMFIYGGVQYILSGGDSGKVKSATKILINASIGLVLIFGAYAAVRSLLDLILA